MAPRPKLQPDALLFARIAAGESQVAVAADYGVDQSNLSRFLAGAGADQLAKARAAGPAESGPEPPAAEAGGQGAPPTPERRADFFGTGEMRSYLDERDAMRDAKIGLAPGQPRTSPLSPQEYAAHVIRTANEPALVPTVTDAHRAHAAELEAWLAEQS